MALDADEIRELVLSELARTGFSLESGKLTRPDGDDKDIARALHASQREQVLADNADFVRHHEGLVLRYFANGDEVDPSRIYPVVKPVENSFEAAIFRYASLLWSVPVSQGYGRRNRFLVLDANNERLIGIFALGDPVINLGPRDRFIGWDEPQRHRRLYNIFDAFVLGAVPPYRELIGGKLVALLTTCDEVTDQLAMKYAGRKTMRGEHKVSFPAAITTTSALGRSSIYNRLTYQKELAFRPVGYTAGFGHFHFPESVFSELVTFVRASGDNVTGEYGAGANYRIRVIRKALSLVDLSPQLLQHGIGREILIAPVAQNWREFLLGETDELLRLRRPAAEIGQYYRDRWAIARAERDPSFRAVSRDDSRLTSVLPPGPEQLSLFDVTG